MSQRKPPLVRSYDVAGPIRDPRTKGHVPLDELATDIAACMALIVQNSGGTCFEADLVGAGFSPAEIERAGALAKVKARERLAPAKGRAA